MIIDRNTTLADLTQYLDIFKMSSDFLDNMYDRLKDHPLPDNLNISFNDLLFRQLIDLQTRIKTGDDILFIPLEVVHNITKEDAVNMSAFDCIRFSIHATNELERITKMFQAIEYKPSSDEIRAGIDNVSHGFFGTIDWYARRMGITDHDEVTALPWIRIYQCLKIDFDNNQFERNYRKVLESKNKISK